MSDGKIAFVFGYAVFIGFLLLIAPIFPGLLDFNGQRLEPTSFPTFSVLDIPGFILGTGFAIFDRFAILFAITTTNAFLTIIVSAYTLGAFLLIIQMIRGN